MEPYCVTCEKCQTKLLLCPQCNRRYPKSERTVIDVSMVGDREHGCKKCAKENWNL